MLNLSTLRSSHQNMTSQSESHCSIQRSFSTPSLSTPSSFLHCETFVYTPRLTSVQSSWLPLEQLLELGVCTVDMTWPALEMRQQMQDRASPGPGSGLWPFSQGILESWVPGAQGRRKGIKNLCGHPPQGEKVYLKRIRESPVGDFHGANEEPGLRTMASHFCLEFAQ